MIAPALASSPGLLLFAARLDVVIPLSILCLFVLAAIPLAARRGKITIPTSVWTGLGAAVLSLVTGKLAGVNGVRGTLKGIIVSVLLFLLVATAVGCFVGLYFLREPPGE